MNAPVAEQSRVRSVAAHRGRAERGAVPAVSWSFVYVFFSNGIPFDAPNRSEPCPTLTP